jgi:hypothetical protein
MILFTKPYVTIEHNADLACITQHWKGFAKSEEFRQGIEKSVEAFRQTRANKIISNTKDFAVVKKEDTDWVATQVTPLLVQLGLKYMAFIIPSSAFTKISVDNFKSKADDAVQIRYFDDQAKAKAWLESVDTAVAMN